MDQITVGMRDASAASKEFAAGVESSQAAAVAARLRELAGHYKL